ncbi:hypothetical protein CEQ90_11820 [Lewinellaceae bacterium SD302]|nr:hypothetical protein CEQ90_11820 [Lewinellaceae bacterium SD302]
MISVSCTEDDYANIEAAERQYASLYLDIKYGDRPAARQHAKQFENDVQQLGLNWVSPNSVGSEDVFRFRLRRARKAWEATRFAIDEDNLPLAALQLDRATYEMSVAHPASFNRLQLGKLYPGLSSWATLQSILEDEKYCGYGWEQIGYYHDKLARNFAELNTLHPLEAFYARNAAEADEYQRKIGAINLQLESLEKSINFQDRKLILLEMDRTDQAIDELIKYFSLPEQEGQEVEL